MKQTLLLIECLIIENSYSNSFLPSTLVSLQHSVISLVVSGCLAISVVSITI